MELELALSASRRELAGLAHRVLDFDGARRASRNLLELAVRGRVSRGDSAPQSSG